MRALRSVAAIAAGFGFMASTVMVGTIIGTALFITGGPAHGGSANGTASVPASYLAATLVFSAVGAVLGGWLSARIGTSAPFGHAAALAAVVAALSAVSMLSGPVGPQPGWYPAVIGVIAVAGVLLGGTLRAAAAAATGGGVVA